MFAKLLCSWVVLLGVLPFTYCQAVPANYNRPYNPGNNPGNNPGMNSGMNPNAPPAEDSQSIIRQMRVAITDLRYEVNNHEAEIRTFESRLHNQENVAENLRQQLVDSTQSLQDLSRAQSINLEGKLESLDNVVKGLISDMRQMKTQSNDSVTILGQYKQKLSDMEKLIDSQNQHMKNLEIGLNSIVEVLQAKEATEKVASKSSIEAVKTYKVQPGDTLEKIARANKVSLQALRNINELTQDRIIVGQTLKIP